MPGQDLQYDVGGRAARAYLATPEGGAGPGVLVLHAWWGLTDTFTGLCDRLAEAGYVAFAPDLFEGSTAQTVEQAEAQMKAADKERVEALVRAALARLRALPGVRGEQVGAVGFSFGAAWAMEIACQAPDEVAAAVIFYGTWLPDFGAARAAFQGHFGSNDDFEPLEGVREVEEAIRSAGREVTFHIYPEAEHWFFEQNRPEYRPEQARLAWERTLAFLDQHLKG